MTNNLSAHCKSNKNKKNNFHKKKVGNFPLDKIEVKADKIPKKMIFALSFFLTSFILLNYQNAKDKQQVLGIQTSLRTQEMLTYEWQAVVNQYPDYRDGWLQLAFQYVKNNEINKAKDALKTARELDPNNEVIIKLEQLIQ